MSSHISFPNDHRSAPDLGLEDFRRLGVRPLECRQTVIRLAALRSSRALAKQQLSSPSDQGSRQLSSLMTSAYRLLDPRQREDPLQRALVGRILPHALSVAGQTNFVSDHFAADQEVPDVAALGGEDGPLIDIAVQPETQPQWTITLGEQDLISRRPSRFGFGPTGFWRSVPPATYVVAALLIVGLLVGATIGISSVGDYLEQLRSHWPTMASATTRASAPGAETAQTDLGLRDDPLSSASQTAKPRDQRAEQSQPTAKPSQPVTTSIDRIASKAEQTDSEAVNNPADESLAEQESAGLATPSVIDDRPDLGQTDLGQPDLGQTDLGQTDPPREVDFQPIELLRSPIPAQQDATTARRQLMAEIPRLAESIDIQAIGQRIDLIMDYADQQPLGTVEHWTAMITLAQHYWLVDDIGHVREQIEFMAENYQASVAEILATSFIESCSLARLPETHQHLFENGLRLCDWLLVVESHAECQRVLDVLAQIDQRPEPTVANRRLRDFSAAIAQTTQFYPATERWIQQQDQDTATSDTGVAGRYYCLMLRNWDRGLPWLAQASDTRLARVARQELDAQDSESRFDVSNRWLEIAGRYDGRVANSMRLHAINLLRSVRESSSAIEQLQIDRRIDETVQALPADLRPVAFSRRSS